jgi:hypothetical protein
MTPMHIHLNCTLLQYLSQQEASSRSEWVESFYNSYDFGKGIFQRNSLHLVEHDFVNPHSNSVLRSGIHWYQDPHDYRLIEIG